MNGSPEMTRGHKITLACINVTVWLMCAATVIFVIAHVVEDWRIN